MQLSFSFTQDNFSSLRHFPYVKLALDFPWEEVFAPIEQEYVNARFQRYLKKRNQKNLNEFQVDLFPHLPKDVNAQPKKSSKGRDGIDFYALFKSSQLAHFFMWKS